ncbi:MAG: nicotinate-nucleotide adenylyltransferase [Burkholderiales bacterium]|nr:nicotinate-nucleotide adenylyltransferase [Burkholderiales bacterium]
MYGGSFDPVHNAHLCLAQSAVSALALESLRFVPSGRPGHREPARAAAGHRLAMLRLALGDDPRYGVDDTELRAAEPTYSVHTLARARSELGSARALVFLIGADQLMKLERWRDWLRLFDLAHFGVARRPGYAIEEASMSAALAAQYRARRAPPERLAALPAGCIFVFDMPPLDISSTVVRRAIASGRPPREAVPAAVLDYIERNGLYTEGTDAY